MRVKSADDGHGRSGRNSSRGSRSGRASDSIRLEPKYVGHAHTHTRSASDISGTFGNVFVEQYHFGPAMDKTILIRYSKAFLSKPENRPHIAIMLYVVCGHTFCDRACSVSTGTYRARTAPYSSGSPSARTTALIYKAMTHR